MKGVVSWFRLLLRLFPAPFRERHSGDMEDVFHSALDEQRRRGRLAVLVFLLRTTGDLVASGLRARLAVGGQPRRSPGGGRAGRGGLASWLDVKLGLRMLRKHPGLTLVSTFALAVGIPVGLAPDHFVDGILAPLPVPEGDRIRTLRLWSPALGRAEQPYYADYLSWREALSSFQDLGAFRETAYNIDAGSDAGPAVRGADVTASTFDILQVRPLLGRTLQPDDETPGAEDVAVLGYDVWQARFSGDPQIIGTSVRLGSVPHTVVGVMPQGFFFPEHQSVWTPLSVALAQSAETAEPVSVFGRLGDGVSDQAARAEFALVGGRSEVPGRDPRVQPGVEAFAYTLLPGLNGGLRGTAEFLVFQALAWIVLLVACVNVGMLIFARTATRAGELAVRTALGASRARIVIQVFTECLVLAVLASGVGLLLMNGLVWAVWSALPVRLANALPYWIDWGITGGVVVHALTLAGVSAVVAGVVPAVRFTGASVQLNIQRARARRTGVRFGGVTGVLIVADVAVAVAAVGFAATASGLVQRAGQAREVVGIAAEEYLAASVSLPAGDAGRMAATQQELVRRLQGEPGVRAVAVADYLPRMEHRSRRVEAEGVPLPEGSAGVSTRVARVDTDFFHALDQPILAGRVFNAGDLGEDRSTVMVNTAFVEQVLGGQNAVGRRIRFRPWGDGEPGPWKEIVGVVGHLGMRVVSAENDQGVYEPLAPGDLMEVRLALHMGDDPTSFVPRLRALAGEVDSEAIVSVIGPLDQVYEGDWYLLLAASLGGGLLVAVLLALAASGIYAIMSFAVAERTTEIGIRTALGAGRGALVRSVARRAAIQIGVGVLLGMPLAAAFFNSGGDSPYAGALSTLAVGVAVMVLVGLAACTGPTLKALRVPPSEALRGEG